MFKDKYELLSQINKDIDEKFKARKKGSQEYYIVSRLKKHFKYDRALNKVIQISSTYKSYQSSKYITIN